MSLTQIRDQETALRLLRNIKRRRRVPSGLLFWGPVGVGKGLTAFEFAKAINCRESEDDACDACLSCRKSDHQNHADIMLVKPEGRSREIKVKVVEQIIETSYYRPLEGRMRVVIFENAERMNEAAQNHFLKTLEEPPSRTMFVLLAEQPRRLLPTIRSRCQRVCFRVLRQQTVADMLERQLNIAGEQAQTIAALSQGSMAHALDLANTDRHRVVLDYIHRLGIGEDPLLVSEGFAAQIQTIEKSISAAVKHDVAEAQKSEEAPPNSDMEKEEMEALIIGLVRKELLEYLRLFDAWYRDELLYGITRNTRIIYNVDHLDRLPEDADVDRYSGKLQAINDAGKYIERNMKAKRVFRDLFFALA